MSKIIGIVGWIGCGKDTVADYLVENYEYKRESFAGALKDAVAAVFSWDRELLEGTTQYARDWRETVDQWWADRLRIDNLTPRLVLQLWGTEVCRENFHNDIWIASLERRLQTIDTNIVISDCRFPNEVEAIQKMGGKVYWVQRGEKPSWFNVAKGASIGNQYDLAQIKALGIHASEWAWLNTDFDAIITNNGTLEDLYHTVDLRISNRL